MAAKGQHTNKKDPNTHTHTYGLAAANINWVYGQSAANLFGLTEF